MKMVGGRENSEGRFVIVTFCSASMSEQLEPEWSATTFCLSPMIAQTHLFSASQTSMCVFVNDDETGLHHDYIQWLDRLAPFTPDSTIYHHNRTGEDKGDARMKRQIMGREVVVAITNGKLDFGPWEQISYGEFDGRRPKRVLIKVIGE